MKQSPNSNKSWNNLQKKLDASFLQSDFWAGFQEALGAKVYKAQGQDWSCLLVERKTPLGAYLFAPYGPTLGKPNALYDALSEITKLGRQAGASWLRLEPCLGQNKNNDGLEKELSRLKFQSVKSPKQVEPLFTRVIDLTPSEDELLAQISKTNRYLIRKNKNTKELGFKTSHDPKDMPLFIDMLGKVSDRNDVFFHTENYFLNQADSLMPGNDMWLEFATKDSKPIASVVMCGFNKTATYLYAASLPEARTNNASAILLWQALLNAKSAGYTSMDLYGVAPEGASPSHPWQGFTAFKQKFGGQVVRRGETIDLPLKKSYYLYRIARRLHRLL